jgi:uncharacterized membrane protein
MTEPMQKHAPTAEQDQRLEIAIAMLLRIGVIAAAILVALGGVLALRHPNAPAPSYSIFHGPGEPSSAASAMASSPTAAIHSITGVFGQLRHPGRASIISLGLLVLIATPIARVVFAAIGFARERDALYTMISLVVLAILAFSLIHGR